MNSSKTAFVFLLPVICWVACVRSPPQLRCIRLKSLAKDVMSGQKPVVSSDSH